MGLVCTSYVLTLRDGPVPVLLLRPGVNVFAWSGEKITVGVVKSVGESALASRLLRILLEAGHSVRMTHDHEVMTLDGERILACHLKPGQRLLPLHLKENPNGYMEFQQLRVDRDRAPETTDQKYYRKVSRMVGEWKLGARFLDPRTVCRHLDRNRKNCDPDNLEVEETPSEEMIYRRNMVGWAKDIRETRAFIEDNARLARPYRYKTPGDLKNHRVAGVHECEGDEVVDMTLEGGLPFVVGNELGGFFVG